MFILVNSLIASVIAQKQVAVAVKLSPLFDRLECCSQSRTRLMEFDRWLLEVAEQNTWMDSHDSWILQSTKMTSRYYSFSNYCILVTKIVWSWTRNHSNRLPSAIRLLSKSCSDSTARPWINVRIEKSEVMRTPRITDSKITSEVGWLAVVDTCGTAPLYLK